MTFRLLVIGIFFAVVIPLGASAQTNATQNASKLPVSDPVSSCLPAEEMEGMPCRDLKNPVFGICKSGICVGTSYVDEKGKMQQMKDLNALSELLKGLLDKLKEEEKKPPPAPQPYTPPPSGCGYTLNTQGVQALVCPDPNKIKPLICSLVRTPTPIHLLQGASGENVTTLQKFLAEQGLFNETPTGYFGPITHAALAQFQLKNGIITNLVDGGMVGPLTLKFIWGRFCADAPTSGGGEGTTGGSCIFDGMPVANGSRASCVIVGSLHAAPIYYLCAHGQWQHGLSSFPLGSTLLSSTGDGIGAQKCTLTVASETISANLANALSALESALKTLRAKLGQ